MFLILSTGTQKCLNRKAIRSKQRLSIKAILLQVTDLGHRQTEMADGVTALRKNTDCLVNVDKALLSGMGKVIQNQVIIKKLLESLGVSLDDIQLGGMKFCEKLPPLPAYAPKQIVPAPCKLPLDTVEALQELIRQIQVDSALPVEERKNIRADLENHLVDVCITGRNMGYTCTSVLKALFGKQLRRAMTMMGTTEHQVQQGATRRESFHKIDEDQQIQNVYQGPFQHYD